MLIQEHEDQTRSMHTGLEEHNDLNLSVYEALFNPSNSYVQCAPVFHTFIDFLAPDLTA